MRFQIVPLSHPFLKRFASVSNPASRSLEIRMDDSEFFLGSCWPRYLMNRPLK